MAKQKTLFSKKNIVFQAFALYFIELLKQYTILLLIGDFFGGGNLETIFFFLFAFFLVGGGSHRVCETEVW